MTTHDTHDTATADIGLIGLGVMGQNLVLNIADHGFRVAVWNRTHEKTLDFANVNPPEVLGPGGAVLPAKELADFVRALKRPRKAIILLPAGPITDGAIDALAELFEPGDIVIDGGNAHWLDTERRETALAARGVRFIGSGVSGGELGARFGPSLMPGGDYEAYKELEPIWNAIAAKVDRETGKPILGATPGRPVAATNADACSAYIGPAGSGHFVKMVHNGIEYADMQLIAEAYQLLRTVTHLPPAEIGEVFESWNTGDLDSYLIEITADILRQTDPTTGAPFVDVILDAAGQKGTGKWTATIALDRGVPVPTIAEAVFARYISALREERERASRALPGPAEPFTPLEGEDRHFIERVRNALHAAKILTYAQGFALIRDASDAGGWNTDLAALARIWRGGCIIRAKLLEPIAQAFERESKLPNLALDRDLGDALIQEMPDLRAVVGVAAARGVPAPAMMSTLSYFDAYRSDRLPASLIQAQRDYFGAHTYERTDQPRGSFYHLDWPADPRAEARL
ncbi:MAG: NADP-dependent phosphogluconate dehydrogenase [Phycisphaerales bacterium]|nr:MAG: NADP-dependent phosphogluconate dehydrogenase [Phycisphaerales bacterium]